ncbi:hypothetical protein [Vreelandella titanicae]|uniref:hypothetical protein n=1 Tax=Vreelandella titanicae TaxID=664683 RepID=UPI0016801DC6|nr:hypothetical protein [Halomonas titanicae]QNU64007.1 hypothetical protein HZS52_06590 [Halomonas titanicae]
MREAAVEHEHHDKHRQAEDGDHFLQYGQPGIARQHDKHGGQHAFGDAPEDPLVCAVGTQHIDDQGGCVSPPDASVEAL